jgi:hypothetical protein
VVPDYDTGDQVAAPADDKETKKKEKEKKKK